MKEFNIILPLFNIFDCPASQKTKQKKSRITAVQKVIYLLFNFSDAKQLTITTIT